jgi:hypothetical protein
MVEGFVAVKPLGSVPVKGLANAVDVYEVTGTWSRPRAPSHPANRY